MKLVVVGIFERFWVFALRQRSLNTTSCPPTRDARFSLSVGSGVISVYGVTWLGLLDIRIMCIM